MVKSSCDRRRWWNTRLIFHRVAFPRRHIESTEQPSIRRLLCAKTQRIQLANAVFRYWIFHAIRSQWMSIEHVNQFQSLDNNRNNFQNESHTIDYYHHCKFNIDSVSNVSRAIRFSSAQSQSNRLRSKISGNGNWKMWNFHNIFSGPFEIWMRRC